MKYIGIIAIVSACLWAQSCDQLDKKQNKPYQEVHISASNEAIKFLSDHNNNLSRDIFTEEGFESNTRIELMSRKDSGPRKDISFIPDAGYEEILLYIHGGAWTYAAESPQIQSCESLSKEANLKVVMPDYPLAPENTYEKAFEHIETIYLTLLKEGKKLIVGGDSAGGNIALAFVESLKEKGIQLPDKLILISPCVDMKLSNPEIEALESVDPSLAKYGLIECAKMWMGDADPEDYHFRPLYGDLDGLPDVLLFTGDKEIFYPDCKLLAETLKGKTSVKFVVGHDLWHIFPLCYILPEGNQGRQIIANFIKSK